MLLDESPAELFESAGNFIYVKISLKKFIPTTLNLTFLSQGIKYKKSDRTRNLLPLRATEQRKVICTNELLFDSILLRNTHNIPIPVEFINFLKPCIKCQ